MGRNALWNHIHDTLCAEISEGQYDLGDRLPTESALAARFGVNRHTVRRALAALSDQGLVVSRRGAGVFVAAQSTDYPIGARVRFHQNLAAAGRLPGKALLQVESRYASEEERDALGIDDRARVHCYDGLSLADGQPIAVFRSVFPAERFPEMPERLIRLRSVTEALREEGIEDYTRATTRVNAVCAEPSQAAHLKIEQGAPLIRTIGINVCPEGRPVEFGITWFAGDRVTLTLDHKTG